MKKLYFILFTLLFSNTIAQNYTGMIPVCYEQSINHKYYRNCYSNNTFQPKWVTWYIIKSHIIVEVDNTTRPKFSTDNSTHAKVNSNEYISSGYDRGHMAPSQDFNWDQIATDTAFLMSNICPQTHHMNAGAWLKTENYCRQIASLGDTVLVISGPLFGQNIIKLNNGRIPIPESFWKIMIYRQNGKYRCLAWIVPNNNEVSSDIKLLQVSVDNIEHITDLDFFSILPDNIENQLESQVLR